MYRIIKGSYPIYAMSTINPQMCNAKSLHIELHQSREGKIPHVHVYTTSDHSKDAGVVIRLDKPEYSEHHNVNHGRKGNVNRRKKYNTLTDFEKEKFIEIMTTVWPKQFIFSSHDNGEYRPATGYEAAVAIWIDTFGETIPFNYDDEGYPIMPDYSQL